MWLAKHAWGRGPGPHDHQNDGWTMAGRARVFSLTLWRIALEWACSLAALAVARAAAAVGAWAMQAACGGAINVEAVHSWWNLGAPWPAAMPSLPPGWAILRHTMSSRSTQRGTMRTANAKATASFALDHMTKMI